MTTERPRYAKTLPGEEDIAAPLDPEAGPDRPLRLRVTLGDMDLEEAFYVTLPPRHARLQLHELVERAFPEEPGGRSGVRSLLDLKANPDLPEMYNALLHLFRVWRRGGCDLRFFLNRGPELRLSDGVWDHLREGGPAADDSEPALLDLVVEQRFRTLDYAVEKGHADSKHQLLGWLQEHTMLHLMAAQGSAIDVRPETEAGRRLRSVAAALAERGLVEASEESGAFRVTDKGGRELESMRAEGRSYARRYDVFGDVLYDAESESAEFDTGRGDDLRSDVCATEGLDPVRVAFMMLLYHRAIDDLISDWAEDVLDEDFFNELLAPAVAHGGLDEGAIDSIIESGFAHAEEQAEESERLGRRRELLDRVRRA